ncbi:MAG TPA: lipid-A-disaccharide synthase [Porticoccaceae bacterium]|jgi:lipid-A-disaccharide synthase|nr:lipid-A-disaccharide synthase [Gammaproteobacteria bacterium]HIL59468.1 lipid-A-disaccharide synthase [Porticoccaceae bacterium]
MIEPIRFGIVAGEKSGDILGAGLIVALKELYPQAEFIGIGGPAMLAAGCRSLVAMDRLSVMGFVEPLGRLPELLSIKNNLVSEFTENPPDIFIGIDSPGFNTRLEFALRSLGIKIVHYVSPSVWAYHESRIHKIKKAVDLMLTLFPFETAIYKQHEIPVACVGHPLADTIGFEDNQLTARAVLNFSAEDQLVALMPGSRSGEIKRLAPTFISAALESLQDMPELKFVIPCSGPEARTQIQEIMERLRISLPEQFSLVDDSHLAISASNLVMLASGTATLEAMLLRRPMIVSYKVASLTYMIASRILKISKFALPNLLANKTLVPEFIQGDVKVALLREQIVKFMAGDFDKFSLLDEFDRLHKELRKDASRRAASEIQKLI